VIPTDCDAKLNRLKALVEKLANKVNIPADTPKLALAWWKTASMRWAFTTSAWAPPWAWPPWRCILLRNFYGGAPKDVDDIEATIERLDGHGVAIADSIHPQSVLNRLFD
jgi:hypothetical protein